MAKKKTIIERVKCYEDGCKELKQEPVTIDQFSFLPESLRQYMYSMCRVVTVIDAMKEGHVFDYNNRNERKNYIWWDMETYGDASPGSGFAFSGSYYDYTTTAVGARLSMLSPEHAKQVATIMHEDWKVIMKSQKTPV